MYHIAYLWTIVFTPLLVVSFVVRPSEGEDQIGTVPSHWRAMVGIRREHAIWRSFCAAICTWSTIFPEPVWHALWYVFSECVDITLHLNERMLETAWLPDSFGLNGALPQVGSVFVLKYNMLIPLSLFVEREWSTSLLRNCPG